MAYPVMNSPFLPSISDAPFLPPKLKEMPIFNPGTNVYQCEDGSTRVMTEAEAINAGMSCKVVKSMGQAGAQSAPSPASPAQPAADQGFDRNFDWTGVRLVNPLLYPAAPVNTPCAWEKDTEGNDIYVCRPEKVATPPPLLYNYGPVSYPTRLVFPGLFY